ncbi:DedA family protein [Pseudonocardia cypriaca]|jgi:membrane protein DedA with SNARE-associated domain|uniref:Membrane protein DedA with SNARE-associated domain n=1 Tax=Pseudonocardia cypriaca TaxID=882449 RepID=A0A543FWR1_9PSEU|nr:VTT domain-containing protein [Pseudonocardia cypriaca]TQM38275.1 membrane protein DedA with SNARE-associated domain [Pseudonocardia cypriaca]
MTGWTDPSALGYSAVFGGVLIGSIVPIVPTGAVVGAAAAIAVSSGTMSLPLVLLLSVLGALFGDLATFAVAHAGSSAAQRWVTGRQSPERLAAARAQFERRGGLLVVVGRLLPAGRIPVLVAAGALEYPWRRFVPAAVLACTLWALAYAALGVLSGGLFDDPVLATVLAAVLVLVLAGLGSLVSTWRRRRRARAGAAR